MGIIAGLVPLVWVGQQQIRAFFQEPQAILVLGGSTDREQYAATMAQQHPDLPVWVSSGSNPEYAEWVFQEAQIDPDRVTLDYRAVDTVTNFTTVVDDLKEEGVSCVYLVTSDYHMRRASIIGQIVLGSRGISFRPLSVPSSDAESEDLLRSMRDGARAVLWVITGHTGSSLAESLGKS
ncbi:YdcF family protein [Pseudanabaena sp. FACHB-2040]|uniref:YdcF family protein n=1 Tax=Pseudanabaena sp. FACHB-2040 TaxID=2692859 RepID=UPI001F55150B|nr:YdcF family protein [Pseudanabaena sp. FACHB-2040]